MNLVEKISGQKKRPPALVSGDLIGIAAPASTFNRVNFEKGLSVIRQLGFNVLVAEDVFQQKGYLAGGDKQRASALTRLFTDTKVKGIICARGGYGTMRLLPYLDFDSIASTPKVFIGFSDVTALLVNLVERCNWVAFHGPTVNTLADTESDSCLSLMQAISLRNPIILFASHGNVVVPGVAVGPLLVGNLTTLCHLVGTPFMPNLCGHILLIEDRGEALYRIDRMLNHMKMAGCFEQLKGLALGHFTECGDVVDIEALAAELFQDYRIPILSGFDVGHHRRNFTLPLGLTVKLDTWNQTLSLQSAATC